MLANSSLTFLLMRRRFLPLFLCFGLVGGCGVGLDDIDLSAIDLGIGDDTGDNEIEAGAKDFVSCNLGQECDYLWQQARNWLDQKARFSVVPKDEVTLEAFSPEPDQYREEFQYRVTRVPHQGGVATIKVEAFCSDMEACEDTAVEQVYQINNFLRERKRELNEGRVELESYEEPELPRSAVSKIEEDDGAFSDISLEREYRRGQYHSQAQEALVGAGCLKQSKMSLLKSDGDEDLYEVSCLTGIRHVVFRCTQDGCTVLQ